MREETETETVDMSIFPDTKMADERKFGDG